MDFKGRVKNCEVKFEMGGKNYRLVSKLDSEPLLTYHEKAVKLTLDLNGAPMDVFTDDAARTNETADGPTEKLKAYRQEIGEMRAVMQRAFNEGCTEDGVDGSTIDRMRPFVIVEIQGE